VTAVSATVQAFFTERLARQRRASPHTIAAYRDTLRLLLSYSSQRAGKQTERPARSAPGPPPATNGGEARR
jgi:integrase/recombinase XerD